MRERIGKLLIGFVAVAIFIGIAETSTENANKKHQEGKEVSIEQKL
ncbi:hypothetical protein [Bacillus pinisoli]|nr:hypothetical protein [Bacillus pinisoli]